MHSSLLTSRGLITALQKINAMLPFSPEEFKTQPTVGKFIVTTFYKRDGVVLIVLLERGATANSARYTPMLNTSCVHVCAEFVRNKGDDH